MNTAETLRSLRQPTPADPTDMRQPRERAVPCIRCGFPTMRRDAFCADHHDR